jgi:hypothetical protein
MSASPAEKKKGKRGRAARESTNGEALSKRGEVMSALLKKTAKKSQKEAWAECLLYYRTREPSKKSEVSKCSQIVVMTHQRDQKLGRGLSVGLYNDNCLSHVGLAHAG